MNNTITLNNETKASYTLVSNTFIEEYMPHASGEYVKIYLYILRISSKGIGEFTLGQMADAFGQTEMDIVCGLKYWERLGLLELKYDDYKSLSAITLSDIKQNKFVSYVLLDSERADVDVMPVTPVKENVQTPDIITEAEPVKNTVPEKKLSTERVAELSADTTIKDLLYLAEEYLGKTLSPVESETILYFYDTLGFSAELIEYLIESCVSMNRKNIKYIERVAISWAEDGVKDVAAAKAHNLAYNQLCFSILKAFGLTGRTMGEAEKQFVLKWRDEYKFDSSVILFACNRTITTISKPSFQYTDSILENWKKAGVKTLEDIESADKIYISSKKKASAVAAPVGKPKTRPVFSNFEQRSYDSNELEKLLLKKNK